jgi:YbbR domain-containing protein
VRGGIVAAFVEGLKNAFTANLGLKLFALAAAIILFSLVHGAEDAQRSIFVDVVAILPPSDSGKMLVSEIPDRVKITLQGSRSLLNSIRREEMEPVQIDLSEPTLRYYYFEPTSFDIPAGVDIIQMAPASIPLTWVDRIERELPIEAQLRGDPGPGLAVQRPVAVDPRVAQVEGAQTELDGLVSVRTEPIQVTGLPAGSHERTVRLERLPPHSNHRGEMAVTVRFEIIPEMQQRVFTGLSIDAVGPPARVRPETVDVTLRGPPNLMTDLEPTRVVPWIDSTHDSLGPGVTAPLPIQIRGLPHGVDVVGTDPEEVLVTLGRAWQPAP